VICTDVFDLIRFTCYTHTHITEITLPSLDCCVLLSAEAVFSWTHCTSDMELIFLYAFVHVVSAPFYQFITQRHVDTEPYLGWRGRSGTVGGKYPGCFFGFY